MRRFGVVVLVGTVLTFGLLVVGQGRGGWEEIAAGLRSHPNGPVAAELAQQAIFIYAGEAAPDLLAQLAPERVAVHCFDADCLRMVVVIPARTFSAGAGEGGPSLVYNRAGLLGLIGTFGGTIDPDLEGFFALSSNEDGAVRLINSSGEIAAVLLASQVFQLAVAPQPIPLPRPAASFPLPGECAGMRIMFEPSAIEMGLGDDHRVQIMLGQYDHRGVFSGVLLFGVAPQPIPLP